MMITDNNLFKRRESCPNCGYGDFGIIDDYKNSQPNAVIFDGACLLNCERCGLIFIDRVFCDDVLDEYYQKDYRIRDPYPIEKDLNLLVRGYTQAEFILQHVRGPIHRSLDVGAGLAAISATLRDRGVQECHVLEVDRRLYRHLSGMGFIVYQETLESLKVKVKFDLIIMSHVLEHVNHLSSFLEKAKGLLLHGGLLFIEVPNWEFPNGEPSWRVPDTPHTLFFTTESLGLTLENHGFRILDIQTCGIQVDRFYPFWNKRTSSKSSLVMLIQKYIRYFPMTSWFWPRVPRLPNHKNFDTLKMEEHEGQLSAHGLYSENGRIWIRALATQ